MIKKSFKLLVFICVMTLLLSSAYSADNNTYIGIIPDQSQVTSVGQIIKVNVATGNVHNLHGIDLEIKFDSDVFTAVDANGNSTTRLTLGSAFSTPDKFVVENKIDNSVGTANLAITLLGKSSGITGSSELAYMYLKVKKVESTTIQIQKKMLAVFDEEVNKVVEMQAESRNAVLQQGSSSNQNSTNTPSVPVEVVLVSNPATSNVDAEASLPVQLASFKDIENSWARQDILEAARLKIISGDGKGNYFPKNKVTREEFAKIIVNALGLQVDNTDNISFKDGNQISGWVRGYVSTISKLGLIKGDNGSFLPKKGLSRYEAAVILARALGLEEDAAACDSFKDKDKIPDWAKGYVGATYNSGLIKGMPDGSFGGTGQVSREQAASLIMRFLELKK